MRGSSSFAIGVCIACFLIGYLTYLAAALIVDFFFDRTAACEYTVQGCVAQEPTLKDR